MDRAAVFPPAPRFAGLCAAGRRSVRLARMFDDLHSVAVLDRMVPVAMKNDDGCDRGGVIVGARAWKGFFMGTLSK
jgi:hypothetical protein